MKAFVRYIDESTDENVKASHVIYSKQHNTKGVHSEIKTQNGIVKTIALGEIEFKNENELKDKVNSILEEMGY